MGSIKGNHIEETAYREGLEGKLGDQLTRHGLVCKA